MFNKNCHYLGKYFSIWYGKYRRKIKQLQTLLYFPKTYSPNKLKPILCDAATIGKLTAANTTTIDTLILEGNKLIISQMAISIRYYIDI